MTDATVLVLAAGRGRVGLRDADGVGGARRVDPEACAAEAAEKAARTARRRRARGRRLPRRARAVRARRSCSSTSRGTRSAALGLLEERSYFAGRIGERVFDEKVSIADDALDPRGLPKAFDFEGVAEAARPARRERRRARRRLGPRARRSARAATSARPGTRRPRRGQAYGPLAFALSVAGGDADSVDELVAAVGDGIYITRLHYLGIVDPREGVVTGMTRDGTFRIRDGKIAEPLVNLRFTVAVPDMLADVPALTREA